MVGKLRDWRVGKAGKSREPRLKSSGIFLGLIFLGAFLLKVIVALMGGDGSLPSFFLHFRNDSLLIIAAALFASAYIDRLAWLKPLLFIGMTPLPLMNDTESFYGLGFFAVGFLLLFRLGFYDQLRMLKLGCSVLYLVGVEFVASIQSDQALAPSLQPAFFIVAFIGFFLLTFRDKIFVYLKEPKPVLSLEARGLSVAEQVYVRAILAGKGIKDASFESGVSESTVRNTLARAYKKLGVVNKPSLIALAHKYDVI